MSGIRTATHVYVCVTRYGTKIGVTSNTGQRARALGRGRVVKTWHRPADAQTVEHTALGLMGMKPKRGHEWFDAPPEQAVAAVEQAVSMADAGTATATPNSRREARAEAEAQNFSDALAEVMRRGNALCAEYERNGYVFDRTTMNFVKRD